MKEYPDMPTKLNQKPLYTSTRTFNSNNEQLIQVESVQKWKKKNL